MRPIRKAIYAEKTDGVTNDPKRSIATLRGIEVFAAKEPTIILPAHDPDGANRLAKRLVLA